MSPDEVFEPDEALETAEDEGLSPKPEPVKANGPTRRRIGGVQVDPETKEPLE